MGARNVGPQAMTRLQWPGVSPRCDECDKLPDMSESWDSGLVSDGQSTRMTRSGLSTTCGSARCPIAKLPMRTPATQSAKQLASEYETESAALSCSGALP